MTYSEKLKDPRWQKKRLEVLEIYNWACYTCTRKDKTLHVHHLRYNKGCDPWEYSTDDLMALCKDCHFVVSKSEPIRPMYMLMLLNSIGEEHLDAFVKQTKEMYG